MKFNSPSVGQFYDINVDMKEPIMYMVVSR